jgi:hypothetical protein
VADVMVDSKEFCWVELMVSYLAHSMVVWTESQWVAEAAVVTVVSMAVSMASILAGD